MVRQWLFLLLALHQKPHVGIMRVSLPHPADKGEMAPQKLRQLSPLQLRMGTATVSYSQVLTERQNSRRVFRSPWQYFLSKCGCCACRNERLSSFPSRRSTQEPPCPPLPQGAVAPCCSPLCSVHVVSHAIKNTAMSSDQTGERKTPVVLGG